MITFRPVRYHRCRRGRLWAKRWRAVECPGLYMPTFEEFVEGFRGEWGRTGTIAYQGELTIESRAIHSHITQYGPIW